MSAARRRGPARWLPSDAVTLFADLRRVWLPPFHSTGFLYGETLTIADVYAVCALRPYMVMDNVLPHQFHGACGCQSGKRAGCAPADARKCVSLMRGGLQTELADRVALAMTGWKTIVGPFDRIVLRGDPSGQEEVLPVGHAEAWEVRCQRSRRVLRGRYWVPWAHVGVVGMLCTWYLRRPV